MNRECDGNCNTVADLGLGFGEGLNPDALAERDPDCSLHGTAIKRPTVLGLDLSLNATGVADSDGTSTLTVPNKIKSAGGGTRLLWLSRELRHRVETLPDLAVIENYSMNPQRMRGMLPNVEWGGVVRLWLTRKRIPYVLIPPTKLKKFATENGNASKAQMIREALLSGAPIATRKITNKKDPIIVEGFPTADGLEYDDNQADAWHLRSMGLAAYAPIEATQTVLETLASVDWPDLYILESEDA